LESAGQPPPDDDHVDTQFWTNVKAIDLQEDLLNPHSTLQHNKKPQISQLKVMQKSRHVLLNQKAANLLTHKKIRINKDTQQDLQYMK